MAVTMYDLTTSNGKINIWGWLICIGTLLLFVVTIWQLILSIKKMHKDESQDVRLKEIEFNLKKIMGNNYQKL